MSAPRSIHLHIERLVIDASLLRPNESLPLQQAVESELTRSLGWRDLPPKSRPRLTSTFEVARNSNAERLGGQIARAVHGSMKESGK